MDHISKEEWDKAKAKGVLKEEDTKGVTDWKKTFYMGGGDAKYGSLMYSKSLGLLRHETFNEFYGSGIVD
jgi:hypothetical protein